METPAKPQAFLLIREKLPAWRSALLGTIPIVVLFLIWLFVTWGKSDVVLFPYGTLDNGALEPQAGRVVKDRTYLKIPGAKLTTDKETSERIVLYQGKMFPLHDLDASSIDDGVNIKLKHGKFIGQENLALDAAKPEAGATPPPPTTSEGTPGLDKPPVIGRGGVVVPKTEIIPPTPGPVVPSKEIVLLKFRYEQVETRIMNQAILPSPGEVLAAFRPLLVDRDLAGNVGISFIRVGKGFLVAFLVIFPLGILMGTFTKIRSMFSPLMIFGGYLPIPTLVPLTMALFGLNETQKIMFLALAFTIYLLPLFVRAVEEVDNVYLQTAYTLGANRFQVMSRVLLGIAWPNLYDAMRMSFGVGWGYIIMAELVGGEGGIGYAIGLSQRRAYIADVYLILVVIVVLAFITDKIWEIVGEWLFPYRGLKR